MKKEVTVIFLLMGYFNSKMKENVCDLQAIIIALKKMEGLELNLPVCKK